MYIFLPFIYVYLGIGFVYAIYIWLFAGDSWYAIPINIVGGPVVIAYEIYRAAFRKKSEFKNLFKGKKAVIFDLDGTIIDSQTFWNQAFENILENIESGWVSVRSPHGLNQREKWAYILREYPDIETDLTVEQLAENTKAEYLKLYQEVVPIEGFWTFVSYLKEEKGFKLGLATNTDKNVMVEILKRLDAGEIFDFTIAGDEVAKRKPHPQIYKNAAKGLGVSSRNVVVFEDTVVGATAARKAGMDVIVIWDGVDEDTEDFPKGIEFFEESFLNMPEAMEKDRLESLKASAKTLEEEQVLNQQV